MTDTLYQILGVRKNASSSRIRAAYRSKAKAAHPDVAGGNAEAFRAGRAAVSFRIPALRDRHWPHGQSVHGFDQHLRRAVYQNGPIDIREGSIS